ncbi:MAG TPA: DoxX-like family protein, partial [Lysobacter sp.]
TVAMLERGNCAPADALAALLGRAPRAAEAFIAPHEAAALRRQAALRWQLPVLRVSIALVWIVTGLVSLGLYPIEQSYALLARTGLTGGPATVALYGAALLDLAFGVLMLLPINRRPLYLAQIALILGYTAIITVALPEFWLHPYGPVLKNLPMLAALWLLLETDRRE